MSPKARLENIPDLDTCGSCEINFLQVSDERRNLVCGIVRAICEEVDIKGGLPNAARNPKDFMAAAIKMAKELGAKEQILPIAGTDEVGAIVYCVSHPSCAGDLNN